MFQTNLTKVSILMFDILLLLNLPLERSSSALDTLFKSTRWGTPSSIEMKLEEIPLLRRSSEAAENTLLVLKIVRWGI